MIGHPVLLWLMLLGAVLSTWMAAVDGVAARHGRRTWQPAIVLGLVAAAFAVLAGLVIADG